VIFLPPENMSVQKEAESIFNAIEPAAQRYGKNKTPRLTTTPGTATVGVELAKEARTMTRSLVANGS